MKSEESVRHSRAKSENQGVPEGAERPVFADIMTLQRIGNLLSRPFFQQYAKRHNLTLNEWRVVVVAHDRPGTAGHEVGRFAGLIPMNVSRAVASLKSAGRIRAETDPENRRQQSLYLTEEGELLFEQIYPKARAHAERLFEVFNTQERQQFSDMLQRLYRRAEDVLGD
ncbi:MarR family winged helix-turn-helix transcriptional regulator [Glutamicibacter arilaitensis]|uniref:MarR family winged helix-turn-helix transcriptional regulator n=1 Tax=Glutamicibacter arilaitensis TaxID=256701 RepID=UPI003850E700